MRKQLYTENNPVESIEILRFLKNIEFISLPVVKQKQNKNDYWVCSF